MQNLKQVNSLFMSHPAFLAIEPGYIIADLEGFIVNISFNLYKSLGLMSKFFKYVDSIFVTKHNIDELIPDLMDSQYKDELESEGRVFEVETSLFFQKIDKETLNSKE